MLVDAKVVTDEDFAREHYPAYIRFPSDVIRFFRATKSAPKLGDLVFKLNEGNDTYHTLIYQGDGSFQHSTNRPDQNGDPTGVITEYLPQLCTDTNYVLSLERFRDYIIRHYEATNIAWAE